MERNKINKIVFAITLGVWMILFYAIMGIVETVNLSSNTVEEAFEKFVDEKFGSNSNQTIKKEQKVYRRGNLIIVPFIIGEKLAFVEFQKGIFGWMQKRYTHSYSDNDDGYSATDDSNGDKILYGVIPKNILKQVKNIKVNGIYADIINVNGDKAFWLLVSIPDLYKNIKIEFLDGNGKVLAQENY